MKPTIKEVALKAGVSIATVSRVLNDKDRVHPRTKIAVQNAIEELKFQPNLLARSMVVKKTKLVGLIIPSLRNEFWAALADEIERRLWELGFSLTLGMVDGSSDKERAVARSFADRKVDGVIYCPGLSAPETLTGNANALRASGIPVVLYEEQLPDFPCVSGDHVHGGLTATRHLMDEGHSRIAFIGGPWAGTGRELGYWQAHLKQGKAVDESLVVRGEPFSPFGERAVAGLLDGGASFSAVFCGNDLIALGVLRELHRRGIAVPDDMSVVGYDDISACRLVSPPLTTVSQPVGEIAAQLVELLLLEESREASMPAPRLVFQVRLSVRESTASPPESRQ